MKRNDFVTNVLKCNNFHCLASLRLVDLNIPVLYQSPVNAGLASLRLVDLNRLPCHNYHCHIRLASLRLVDLNLVLFVI